MAQLVSQRSIDFMGKRQLALVLSAILAVMSLGSLIVQGLSLGLDFTGGTLVEVGYPASVDLAEVRNQLAEAGYEDAAVQHFGTTQDILIRVPPDPDLSSAALSDNILQALSAGAGAEPELRRVEFVGPQVGKELTEKGGLALLFALFGILIYIAWRFEYRFALGAIAALVHDVIITLGFFSLTRLEFDLTVLAALLAVIGYSLNDTIVVYDRIRENFRRLRRGEPAEIINTSITQTLSRTLLTSGTTLLVLISLAVLGGEIIRNFAIALIFGVVVGTYSSIYVASAFLLLFKVKREDLLLPEKEVADAERL
ncbi:protein translocase subunit SecF [Methylohalobius crimeensis]|uniref:protein translocase subunit SecF n=1 Tax=Methylohalobius crimeensis TaxID=244365 RepID=UPI0003B4F4C4|nr:protein translocase subunit SecF [Methylohalobius crimeensis]